MTESFKIFQLENGLRYVHSKVTTTKLVTVAIFFRLGSIWENEKFYGGSHFLEHFLFKGCDMYKNAKDLNTEFDNLGAIVNASTSHEYTNFYGCVSVENFEKFFNIISNMVVTPVFNPEEFEKEKNVVIEELKRYLDKPEDNSEEELYTLLFGKNHRLGRKIGGEVSEVKDIKLESLKEFHKKYYIPQNACISICGNVQLEDVHRLVCNSLLAKKSDGNVNAIEKSPIDSQEKLRIKIMKPEQKQEHCYINIGFNIRDICDKNETDINDVKIDFISNILNCGMSSRLFQDLRENHGISYSQSAGYDCFIDCGLYVITTSVDCPSIYKTIVNGEESEGALEILSNQVNLLKNEKVGDKEMKKVKACSLSHIRAGYEKSHRRCLRYGEDLICSEDSKIMSITEEEEIIKNITADEILELSQKIFDFNNCSICISGHLESREINSLIEEKALFKNM
tara:strand:+ start:1211 stop:2569 length:1359 start_codon:yes stop_codon:yes gene_type:complete